jgi:hypothetical protein
VATTVKYEIPVGGIEKIGIRITRGTGNGKYGVLGIWQNDVGFKPADHEKYYVVSWDDLTKWITENGRRDRKKTARTRHEY